MRFVKENLPWVASTAALVIVGVGYFDNGALPFGKSTQDAAETEPTQQIIEPETTLDVIAAVTPEVQTTTAQELTEIIENAAAPNVTRSAPIDTSFAPLPDTSPNVSDAESGPSIADDPLAFFAAAQANIAANDACGDDLKALAAEARIYFPSGGLSPADAGLAQARLLSRVLADCPGYIVQVGGHSDPSGDPKINLALSKQRAEAVIGRIAASGIDTSKLVATGYGDVQPSNVQGAEDPAYYDRRVEFTVVAQEQTQLASFSTTNSWQPSGCAVDLEPVAAQTKLFYAPRAITVSSVELAEVLQLAVEAANCNGAKLRIVGHHSGDVAMRESITTGRHRALAIMNTLVAAGVEADQILIGAPSWSEAIPGQPGLPNSRVDFQIVAVDG